MTEKTKTKRVLQPPARRGSIPQSEVLKAIKKVAAARRRRQQSSVADERDGESHAMGQGKVQEATLF